MSAATLRRHPLLSPLLAMNRRNVPWLVALRNTAAIVLPVAAGELAGQLMAGLAVSVGALVTMFADQPGAYRLRLQRTLLTALAAGTAAFAGSFFGQWHPALVLVAALWTFAGALLAAVGPHATRAGLVSVILLIIMGAEPHTAVGALPGALLILGGGVLQSLIAIAAWPLQRYRPERLALAAAFSGLAGAARQAVAAEGAALPPSLNELQSLLHGSGRARGRAVEAFHVLAELAERMRIELLALADLESSGAQPLLRAAIRPLRKAAADVLTALAGGLARAEPPAAQAALATFATAMARLDALAAGDASPDATVAAARGETLGGQLRAAVRNADTAGSRGEIRAQHAEFRLPRALRPANPLATLAANLRRDSPAFRHAVRCSVCIAIALLLEHQLPLSRGYWLPMTVAIVLRPDFGATWRVGLLRVAGTIGGLLLTTVFLHFAGVGNFWLALALMAVLCFAYRELAAVHYGVAVVCLTGLVVILLSFYGIPAETAVQARALDTALGSTLALAAYLVWPTWERGREREALARMLESYRDYLVAVLSGDARARHETRIAARAARSAAQASLDRLRAEPTGERHLPRAETLVAQANRFVRVAMLLEAARADADGQPVLPELQRFTDACGAALRDCTDALRAARTPTADRHLRERQRALVDELAQAPATPWTLAVRAASDRIVDAIDTVAHVLAQAPGPSPART
ncbi:MAG TPA: FUSC family protein [Rhodanobacteraceae bacterium]|nr:FUSC family protein [Rhodanobacteraceae bacterium]